MTFKKWWQTNKALRSALAEAVGTSETQLKRYAYQVCRAGPKRAIALCEAIQKLTPDTLVDRSDLRPDLWK